MCKRQPGLRCIGHARHVLEQDYKRSVRHRTELAELMGAERLNQKQRRRRDYLMESVERLDDAVLVDRADLNACAAQLKTLTLTLAGALQGSTRITDGIRRTAVPVVEGKLQRAERYRQVAMMPTPPGQGGFPAVVKHHRDIGAARSTMACTNTQMVLHSTNLKQWKHWQQLHQQATRYARMSNARYHAELLHGPGWWARADEKDRRSWRAQAMMEADFTTQVEPLRLVEVLEHHIAKHDPGLADGHGVDPLVDSPSWVKWRCEGKTNTHGVRHLQHAAQQAATMLTGLVKTDQPPGVVESFVESMLADDPAGWALLKLIFSRRKLETTSC